MSATVETIKVDLVSMKFGSGGVRASGVWYNISKTACTPEGVPLSGDYFQKGETYSVVVGVTEKGSKYINGIVGASGNKSVNNVQVVGATPGQPVLSTVKAGLADDKMSKEDWATRNKQISKQGFLQNALDSVIKGSYTAELEKARDLALETAKWEYQQVWGEEW